MLKRCSKCNSVKDINKFSRNRTTKDGYQRVCKECVKEYYKENKEKKAICARLYRKKNKKRITEASHIYYENKREELLRKQQLYRKKNNDKILEQTQRYRERNRKQLARKQRIYAKTNKGKMSQRLHGHKRRQQAKGVKSDLTTEQWIQILKKQNNRCNMCKKRFSSKRLPTMDHIIPLSKSGGLTSDNIQALCNSCNSVKNAKLEFQYIQTWAHERK